ncbi:MAG: 6-carboxytetrahydropterin synthase QueD, partial [Campylobacter sp.]|nr:6-carboxytetrahydropterin synthase QueD [Campylobacter sp.]
MKIGRLYSFEAAHVVRDCASKRCKYSIHGHSY